MLANIDTVLLIETGIRAGIILIILLLTFLPAKLVRKAMARKDHFIEIPFPYRTIVYKDPALRKPFK